MGQSLSIAWQMQGFAVCYTHMRDVSLNGKELTGDDRSIDVVGAL